MIAALVALAVVLFVIAQVVGGKSKTTTAQADAKSVAERIKPVGEVTVAGNAVMDALIPVAQAADKGKSVYDQACQACHAAGVAGAPKLGDKAAWKDRIAQGNDKLYEHSLKGFQGKKGVMPPKGGFANLSDADVKAAVDYMVSKAK
ncbi:MAG: cytochrome c5 family protein [Pseudomonadota bacterium]|nr:MAG: cytochrome c5 family protein [Pseudomonadota bacterium]